MAPNIETTNSILSHHKEEELKQEVLEPVSYLRFGK